MQVSMEWLSEYLDLSQVTGIELADLMSRTGIEIEAVENYGSDLEKLVIGEVVECYPHSDSDHLYVTKVNIGEEELSQIVCGAPNVAEKQKVIVALPGAILPGNFEIKASVIRGVQSNGMIVSLQELGFSDSVVPKQYVNGIYILPEEAPIGENAVDYLKLDDDILELDITPNRADALSVRGVAYEVGAIVSQTPSFKAITDYPLVSDSKLREPVSVKVEMPELSNHYQLRVIKDVSIEESPVWLQIRLMKAGIRPINNIVDITNYFLLLYGQPMHAFDYDSVDSTAVSVVEAEEGQSFTTLDGVERILSSSDVLIKTGNEASALAGVMGGLDSEVTPDTRNVLLETAVFNRHRVRATSKKFALRSESSARFEKGINEATLDEAGQQAAALMALIGHGAVVDGVAEHKGSDVQDVTVKVNYSSLPNRLGITLSKKEIEEIIHRLGFTVSFEEETFSVTVPPRRWDITIEADILEEIARIYGYDNIPTTLPAGATTFGELTEKQKLVRHTRQLAEGFGLNQVITYVLTSPDKAKQLKSEQYPLVELELPMSEDRSVLRQSMFSALMEVASFNKARQNRDLAFYETGRVFFGQKAHTQPIEEERFSILISGSKQPSTWYQNSESYDFYDLKGIMESYFEMVRVSDGINYVPVSNISVMHPGRTAVIHLDNQPIGIVGQVHPLIARDYDLVDETFFMEVQIEALLNYHRKELIQVPISKYPSTSRDLALLVDEDQTNAELVQVIEETAGQYLVSVELFDLYQGKNIEEGKKSMAYHLTFQNSEKTLTDDEIDQTMTGISTALTAIEGLEIR